MQSPWYDITIRMTFGAIRSSSGLCTAPLVDKCDLEVDGGKRKRSRKLIKRSNMTVEELMTSQMASSVCEQYTERAIESTNQLHVPFCSSVIGFLVKEGINEMNLEDDEYQLYIDKSASVMEIAVQNASDIVDILISNALVATNDSTQQIEKKKEKLLTNNEQTRPSSSSSLSRPTTSTISFEFSRDEKINLSDSKTDTLMKHVDKSSRQINSLTNIIKELNGQVHNNIDLLTSKHELTTLSSFTRKCCMFVYNRNEILQGIHLIIGERVYV
ncbi:unnamed protein product [Didymodactylos carnosus]|uniref:Uncharacterized protein n=1 Tax=Didymodactylos carnosus TaxID=1234261 RepID=A0A813Y8H2_9BILA|nr:unnamed protein product [Didymodactylos carnosus]CAF3666847.1 unnamed protein product [Didymodactylos carnosus]